MCVYHVIEFDEVNQDSKLGSSSIYISGLTNYNHITAGVTRLSQESHPRCGIYRIDRLISIVFARSKLQKMSAILPDRFLIIIQLEIDCHFLAWLPRKQHARVSIYRLLYPETSMERQFVPHMPNNVPLCS